MLYLTLALALGWGLFWAQSAYRLKSEVAGWFEARRQEGWQADYTDLSVRGFPNRLDVTLSGLRLRDPMRGIGWEAPFFQVLGLSYKPGHQILVWPDSQTLTLPDGRYRIDSSGLRASVIHTAEGTILRANLEAEVLNVDGPRRALALAGLTAGLQQVPGASDAYRVGLAAEALAGPDGPLTPGKGRADGLQVQAEIGFDRPWSLDAPAGPRPQPRRIDLRMAEYRFEGLELNLAGRLSVDARGRGTGEMTLRAVNWREMLARARDTGQLPDSLADTLESGLSLAAGLKGNPKTLDLPLRFDEGALSLGVIPLGEAPRLSLP